MTSFSIFMPAYNAGRHLEEVVNRIPSQLIEASLRGIYIINDGSQDDTPEVIARLEKHLACIRPVHFSRNLGYGTVVKEGISLCRQDGCDYAVCLHSDGQYPPEKIPDLLGTAREKKFDVLQGSRHAENKARQGGMPLYKIVAGRVLCALENRAFGLKLTDYHSGFLCYSRKLLESIDVSRLSSSFDIDLEIIASARAQRLAIGEIPIPTRYADEVSYLNPLAYGFRVLKVVGKYLANVYGPSRS